MKIDVRRRAKDRDGDSSQPGCRRVEVEKKMGELGLTVVAGWNGVERGSSNWLQVAEKAGELLVVEQLFA
ncbi:hypothetical protein AMTR_s00034p00029430 [Amborella trichopoda]|uniref:Uncharacterized protein n=1 Tax=Amborella trichopoda TaxID=13333 RepID=W1PWD2_AMBTC|nr:hypothetical protein AMTR_s00034p00029430 [Amborella trichopoda]